MARNEEFHLDNTNELSPTPSATSSTSSVGPKLTRDITHPTGTFSFFHPTHAHLHVDSKRLNWTSRDHRKGRHPIETGKRRRISRFFGVEWWNISWWVAFMFTLGSCVWVINGFFVFLPEVGAMSYNNTNAEAWSAFAGGTIFEIGGVLMIFESLNRRNAVCFGDAVEGIWMKCIHHFHHRCTDSSDDDKDCARKDDQKWCWWGTRWREIGFNASVIQCFAATIFWVSTITGIPGVINMNNVGLVDGIYWTPQVIGGTGFIISSLLFLIETQPAWWHIRPFTLGWHVGFWNLIGALGFTLCGAFGFAQDQNWALFQSTCSTFWGSWAFLIGSIAQWIEALNR